jgi:hypothetical protein
MRSCKYIVYVRDYCSHSENWRMCAVFGTKFVVQHALNCRDISNGSADTFSRMLKPEYAELQLHCICPGPQYTLRKLAGVRCIQHADYSITLIELTRYLQ